MHDHYSAQRRTRLEKKISEKSIPAIRVWRAEKLSKHATLLSSAVELVILLHPYDLFRTPYTIDGNTFWRQILILDAGAIPPTVSRRNGATIWSLFVRISKEKRDIVRSSLHLLHDQERRREEPGTSKKQIWNVTKLANPFKKRTV